MIVVTAPTGTIGSQVLARLLDCGEPIRVIARDPGKLPDATRKRVDVIAGSHGETDVVMRAFDGADTVFWLVPGDPRAASPEAAYVDFSRAACEAMKACGVKRVVGISALGRGWPQDAGHVSATLKADDLIAATGVAYRALLCPSLMENVLRQTEGIRDRGAYCWTSPADLKMPHCATRDVAAVSAELLLDRTWDGVDGIPLLGPEDLSAGEMTDIISDVLGRPVSYHQMTTEDLRAMVISRGTSQGMAQGMVNMMIAKNEGMDTMVGLDPETRRARTPTTFRRWCEDVLKPAALG